MLSGNGYAHKIDLYNLIYIEVAGRELVFHIKGSNDLTINCSMKKIESRIQGKMFFRCSQGFIVNLEYVDEIDGMDAIVDGRKIPVSKGQKRAFVDALNNYMSEVRG